MTVDTQGAEEGWMDLTGSTTLSPWQTPTGAWAFVGDVHLDPSNPRRLAADPGTGTLYNGPTGRANNLVTKEKFHDLEAHVEFLIPKGSNSGVKFGGVYEIQILDSHGKDKLTGNDCGGIYPRAESKPTYHYLDEGHPPGSMQPDPPENGRPLTPHSEPPDSMPPERRWPTPGSSELSSTGR